MLQAAWYNTRKFPTPRLRWLDAARCHGTVIDRASAKPVNFVFVAPTGEETLVKAFEKQTVLEAAHDNDVALEGACEGSLACSTCHGVIERGYDSFQPPTEREEDLLDQAPGLTSLSRLCCQLRLNQKSHDQLLRVRIPKVTRNFYVDGHIPKPH